MATPLTSTAFDPGEIVVARTSFSRHDDTVLEGEERRAGDPVVLRNPEYFVPAGTPKAEWNGLGAGVISTASAEDLQAEAAYRRAAKANRVTLVAAPVVLRATRDLTMHVDGVPATVVKDSTQLPDSPYVAAEPDGWEEVMSR